ncbi:MAG: helix-turn-helix transcriptional regulator [Adlercreutzia sp.]|nr:helix-turn-helix transcriptional regulator [Adlercreutzia sp.]
MLNASLLGAEPARRHSTLFLAAALTAFGGACLLAGAAVCLALIAPTTLGVEPTMLACAAVAGAAALVGIGLLLALRERNLRTQEVRLTSRAARIQSELDSLGLTPKEMAVAQLILQHRSYGDIGQLCHLAPRTVQFHASNIYRKAYVTRRRDFEQLLLADADRAAEAPYECITRIRTEEENTPR